MNSDRHPAPGPTIRKPNGQWTFYVFPDGQQREAGQFETEAAAQVGACPHAAPVGLERGEVLVRQ